jgi:GTPase-associated protein 1
LTLTLEVVHTKVDLRRLAGFDQELLANLATAAVDGGEKTALLIGDEAQSRAVLEGLYATLATEERLRLTFSTHFYESNHLRPLFAFVTVRSRAEAPAQRHDYTIFDLDDGEFPSIWPASAYSDWLSDCLRSGRWEDIDALNAVLNKLRGGHQGNDFIPTGKRACAALWERAGTAVAPALVGDARLVVEFLRHSPAPRPLADALLAAAAPSELCGVSVAPDSADACLSALYSKATRKGWRAWTQRWKDDTTLISFLPKVRPCWQLWKRM